MFDLNELLHVAKSLRLKRAPVTFIGSVPERALAFNFTTHFYLMLVLRNSTVSTPKSERIASTPTLASALQSSC